jgi:thiol-disulfide isomerase/thioredoxin
VVSGKSSKAQTKPACSVIASGSSAADSKGSTVVSGKSSKTQPKVAEKSVKKETEKTSLSKVTVYSFYGKSRCPTCRKIEQYTKETVEQNFLKGTYAGRVTFTAINVEEKPNEHFVKDYQLVSSGVVLQAEKDGKPGKWENLDGVWVQVGDKAKFFAYIKDNIIKSLGGK